MNATMRGNFFGLGYAVNGSGHLISFFFFKIVAKMYILCCSLSDCT